MLPTILLARGIPLTQAITFMLVQAISAFFGYTACGFLIDRFGRRPVLFLYFFIGAFFHLWFALASGIWLYFAAAAVGWVNPGVFGSTGIYVSELHPTRLRATDPGQVEGNPVFVYHDAFNPNLDEVKDLKARYTKGTVGDVEVKQKLVAALNQFLDPIRERRAEYERQPGLLEDILAEGSRRARAEARETLDLAREAMGLNYFPKARELVDASLSHHSLKPAGASA